MGDRGTEFDLEVLTEEESKEAAQSLKDWAEVRGFYMEVVPKLVRPQLGTSFQLSAEVLILKKVKKSAPVTPESENEAGSELVIDESE